MRHATLTTSVLALSVMSATSLFADTINVNLNAFANGSSVTDVNAQTAGGGQWWNPSNGSVSATFQSGLGRTGGTALVIGNNGNGNNGVVNNCATGRLTDAAGESTVAPNKYFEASYWFRTASSTYVNNFNLKSEGWGVDRTTWMRFQSNGSDGIMAQAWGIGNLGDGVNDTGGYFTANGGFDQTGNNLLKLDFGSWYRVGLTVTFVDGANGVTNDIVTHSISNAAGALLGSLTATSWEQGARGYDQYNNGQIFGIDKLGFDSRMWGAYTGEHAYVDGISYSSFAVPAPGAAALLGLAGAFCNRRRRN